MFLNFIRIVSEVFPAKPERLLAQLRNSLETRDNGCRHALPRQTSLKFTAAATLLKRHMRCPFESNVLLENERVVMERARSVPYPGREHQRLPPYWSMFAQLA